jgi:tetratricopeptide (TPR) repeat protein
MKFLSNAIFFLIFLTPQILVGQSAADANKLFESGNCIEAREMYQNLLTKKATDPLYNYRYARCLYELDSIDKSIEFFAKAGEKYPLKYYYLGKMYFKKYYFEESVISFEKYLASLKSDHPQIDEVNKMLQKARIGESMIRRVEDVVIIDSVIVDKNNFVPKIPISKESGKIVQQILKHHSEKISDRMCYTTNRADRRYQSEFNGDNFDLFTSFKLLDEWEPQKPIESLNTNFNENYPFLLLDGLTFYFASDREESLGGYDIFITRLNTSNNTFLKPDNIGMPFNSPYNDYMMVIDENKNRGWFVSDRFLPEGKVTVYQFIPNKEKRIIRSENKDSVIQSAIISHFSTEFISNETKPQPKPTINTTKTTEFIFINNETTYSSRDEFTSNRAKELYLQLQNLTEEFESLIKDLEKMRSQYRISNEQDKIKMSEKILLMEREYIKKQELIQNIKLKMRNEEISSLRK